MEILEGNLIKWIWDLWAKFNPIIFRVEEAKTDRIKIVDPFKVILVEEEDFKIDKIKIAVKIKVLIPVEEEEIKIN